MLEFERMMRDSEKLNSCLDRIRGYMEDYRGYLSDNEEYIKKIRGKESFLKKYLSKDRVDKLSEEEVKELRDFLNNRNNFWAREYRNKDQLYFLDDYSNVKDRLKSLLWDETVPLKDRLEEYKIGGLGLASVSELLCFLEPSKYAISNNKIIDAFKLLDVEFKVDKENYDDFLNFSRELLKILKEHGLTPFGGNFLDTDLFLHWLSSLPKGEAEEKEEGAKVEESKENKRKTLERHFELIGNLLSSKGQVILYGPPGTGKTFIAKRFVNDKKHYFVTFHSSYSYEEFVEGIRPVSLENGEICYVVKDGIFKRSCLKALCLILVKINEYKKRASELLEAMDALENDGMTMENLRRYEKAKRGILSKLNDISRKISKDSEPFYLIIDEINRGDVSKILGELITLLERDKRIGMQNFSPVILPYSQEPFGVPPNLYIIGTMNTADRSIALIDVALRRRFAFLELMPDYRVLGEELLGEDCDINSILAEVKAYTSDKSLDDVNKLKKLSIAVLYYLNEGILELYDRDHQIGHSYLLREDFKGSGSPEEAIRALKAIWFYEIIPLLREYFYNDPGKLKEVLRGQFLEEGKEAGPKSESEYSDEKFVEALLKLRE